MEGTKNINKKLLITIFTFLFLIGFIYSVYPQATSPQNNATSSLESNSIIQWIITSSANGYSTAAQYLANFLSIKNVPTYVWTIITFLMATLFFIAIYTFLFEIFIQKTKVQESDTMKKAKILFIFALGIFSAIAIGFAIPFLFSLYGFILLIVLLIALFFFGRAIISYGRIFHHSVDLFAAEAKKSLVDAEKAARALPKEEENQIIEGIEKIKSTYNEAESAFRDANKKFENALSDIEKEYKSFINSLKEDVEKNNKLQNEKDKVIRKLREIEGSLDSKDPQTIPSINGFYSKILNEVEKLGIDQNSKDIVIRILKKKYDTFKRNTKITSKINDAIDAYKDVEKKLWTLFAYEKSLNDIGLRIRKSLGVYGNRTSEIAMLSQLNESKKEIEKMENLVNERIQFLEDLLH